MLLQRSIVQAHVRAAWRTNAIKIAAPSDFTLGPRTAYTSGGPLLPYCLDFVRKRTIYAAGVDVGTAEQAPFYYLHLRRTALTIVSVPWEAGALTKREPLHKASFLFSPGRCGSTLLSRILLAAGVSGVSEPDFYSQLSFPICTGRLNPLRPMLKRVAANLTSDLVNVLPQNHAPVFKLRSECCAVPDMILDGSQAQPSSIFMIRDFEPWARSTLRTFSGGPRRVVAKYLEALRCYDFLKRNTRCHLVRYEDLQRDPFATCEALSGFLGQAISHEAVTLAMETDAQEGTPVGRPTHKERGNLEGSLDRALALWQSPAMRRRRENISLYDS